MDTYFSATNDVTEVIDDSFYNIALIKKERFYYPQNGAGETRYYGYFDVDITGIEHPVVAYSSICAASYYTMTPNKVTLCVGAFTQQNVPDAVQKLNNPNNYIDVYVFGRPKDNTENIGLKIWDANGKMVFDANHRYMKPQLMHMETAHYSPAGGGSNAFNNNKTLTLPAGKSYAVFPLNRIFAIQAEYISDGWETYWKADIYSSTCAIDGNTVYLTSGLVESNDDENVTAMGACRHHYAFIDVTDY